jgi:hypothetical protein
VVRFEGEEGREEDVHAVRARARRPLRIDIEHQQRNELIKPSKATPKAAAAAASVTRVRRGCWSRERLEAPQEQLWRQTLEVGGAVAGVGRYAWEHQGAIQHPDEAIRTV